MKRNEEIKDILLSFSMYGLKQALLQLSGKKAYPFT